ncbi:MAG: hypothetical protein AB2A00_34165 [Myxococcota bacterium]
MVVNHPRRAAVLSALVATTSLLGLVALLVMAAQPAPGTGFTVRRSVGILDCAEPSVPAGTSREPYVNLLRSEPFCASFTAYMVADRRMELELELDVDDGGSVTVDGTRVLDAPFPHSRITTFGKVTLERGVHEFRVNFEQGEGWAFLRLFAHDHLDPHMQGALPLETNRFFLAREDAEAALADGRSFSRDSTSSLVGFFLLSLAGVATWIFLRALRAMRARQPLELAGIDVGLGVACFLVAFGVRAYAIPQQDVTWDEGFYWGAGEHYVRNVMLGDFTSESYRFNKEHPPLAKWFYGVGSLLGGHDGARYWSAGLNAFMVVFAFAFALLSFGRRAALISAAVLAFLPHLVAHGRLSGLESAVLFFWTGSVLALLIWLRSISWRMDPERPGGNSVAAFLVVALAILGMASRLTGLWLMPLVFGAYLYAARDVLRRGWLPVPLAGVAGVGCALLVVAALWMWLWDSPLANLSKTAGHWRGGFPTEWYFGKEARPPGPLYFLTSFLAMTPVPVLVAGGVGAVVGLRSPTWRRPTLVLVAAFLLPFVHSITTFRQDMARYVSQAWPALGVLASLPVAWLASGEHRWLSGLTERARSAGATVLGVALVMHTAVALVLVEPYPLDYYGELVGGPRGVAEKRTFEIAWWGEGIGDAVAYLNVHAAPGSVVDMRVDPAGTRARLRDDLVQVREAPADYVVVNNFRYQMEKAPDCPRVHRVTVRDVPLVEVLRCPRPTGNGS